jgi:hypothetical protein
MNEAEIARAAATFRSRYADAQGRVPPAETMLARAERQLLHLLREHGAYEPLRPYYAEAPADEGLSFAQATEILGGFAEGHEPAFMRLGYLLAVLMKDAGAAETAGRYLELPPELHSGGFYRGPAFGRV